MFRNLVTEKWFIIKVFRLWGEINVIINGDIGIKIEEWWFEKKDKIGERYEFGLKL